LVRRAAPRGTDPAAPHSSCLTMSPPKHHGCLRLPVLLDERSLNVSVRPRYPADLTG
jgi:hypothetical protein